MSTCPSSSASAPVHHLLDALHNEISRSWTLMEVCGGQTHAILRHGLDQLIPRQLELIHGPGCPVCVTAAETIDRALQLASLPEVILCSYGDMLRVPGSGPDHLLQARAAGADVRLVTAPSMPWPWRGPIPSGRWCSSPWASRPPPRPRPCSPTRP